MNFHIGGRSASASNVTDNTEDELPGHCRIFDQPSSMESSHLDNHHAMDFLQQELVHQEAELYRLMSGFSLVPCEAPGKERRRFQS
jgi:hypothetical protein